MGMDWPWQYSFPPFFTIQVSGPGLVIYSLLNKSTDDNNFLTQPHSATKAKQLEAWRHLVLNYCQVESAVSSQEMKTKISRFIQYLSLIWLTLETCPCFTTQAYREDCQPRQYSQSLKILPSSEWILTSEIFLYSWLIVATWSGQTRANAEVTSSGSPLHSLVKRYTSEDGAQYNWKCT